MTLGYEMVSEVVEVAPDVTAVEVGDLVHTGTPHQEETVLDVAASLAATYPLVVLPTDGAAGARRCSSRSRRWRCRPCTTRRSSSATR